MEIKTVKKMAIRIHGEGGYKLHLLIYLYTFIIIYKIVFELNVVVQKKNFACRKRPKLLCMYRFKVHTHYFLIYLKSFSYY